MEVKEQIASRDYSALDIPEILSLIFHPVSEVRSELPPGCIDYDVPVGDGVKVGVRCHLPEQDDAPNIIFFHGNGELASDYDTVGPSYNEQGLGFIVADFRGYGWSGGEPTVSAMLKDSREIFDFIKGKLTEMGRTGKLIVMGRSLGSASALELAALRQDELAGIIIESGFANTCPLLATLGVDCDALGIKEENGIGNLPKIKDFLKPILILHAQNDQIIPLTEAAALHAECGAAAKELQMIPGADHNNILEKTGRMYFEVLAQFVRKTGRPARRKKSGVR
ncbi:MAG: alpha/beta fold hydrolase [Thermodesulfobacteriota bacterium]